jgi:hypothetical protein
MLPDKKVKCPYTGFTKTCFDGVTKHHCPKWIQLQGKHPQTGDPVNEYNCSDAWLPMLLIENANESRKASASTDSLRNVVADINGYVPTGSPPLMLR